MHLSRRHGPPSARTSRDARQGSRHSRRTAKSRVRGCGDSVWAIDRPGCDAAALLPHWPLSTGQGCRAAHSRRLLLVQLTEGKADQGERWLIDFESFCRAVQRMIPRLRLSQDSQLYPVIRCVNQILLRTQVPLGRLNRRVTQEQLDLLKLTAGSAAHLRAASTEVMGGDSGNTCDRRVRLKQLPDGLFRYSFTLYLVPAHYRAQHVALGQRRHIRPGVDGALHPRWHRDRPHPAVLPDEVHDAPPTVPLLDVPNRQCRDLGP